MLSVWIESSQGTHSEEAIRMMSQVVMNRYHNYYSTNRVFTDPFQDSFRGLEEKTGLSRDELIDRYMDPENGNNDSFTYVKELFLSEYNSTLMGGVDPTHGAIFFIHASNINTGTKFSSIQDTKTNLVNNSEIMVINYTSEMAAAQGQLFPFSYVISNSYYIPGLVDPTTGNDGWIILYAGNNLCIAAASCGLNWLNTIPLYPAN